MAAEPTDSIFYVYKDYLGSLLTFTHETTEITYEQNFDAWGRYRNTEDWSYEKIQNRPRWMYRGYTGHEHLYGFVDVPGLDFGDYYACEYIVRPHDAFNLINMNGRLYDPVNGRMLSVDNYVQESLGSQGHNRYTYAGNNPLKYTDPSGELIGTAMAIGAAVFGLGNLAAHAIRGDVTSFGKGLKYFVQGAIVGATLGAGVSWGLGVPVLGAIIKGAGALQAITTTTSIIGGAITHGGQGIANAGKIALSNFYLDENKNWVGAIWEGISRHTYQFLQTNIAYIVTQFSNTIGKVDDVEYFGGATFSHTTWKRGSITLGNNIMLGGSDGETNVKVGSGGYTFMHEYGHYIQSQTTGYVYLFKYGLASLSGSEWTEWDANQRSANYMKSKFGFIWNSNYYTDPYYKRYSYLPGYIKNPRWYDFIPPITFFSSLWR